MTSFAALDFETADHGRDSACAIGLVRVDDAQITARAYELIRPPRRSFTFTYVHGLTWKDVAGSDAFADVWQRMVPLLEGVSFIAAHNASFDRSVLNACCTSAGMPAPSTRFLCTVALARRAWNLYPTRLPDVCGALKIPLRHHHAAADAEACALIALRAQQDGVELVPERAR